MKSISLEFDISLQVKFGFPQINYRRYPVFFDQHFHMQQFFRQLSVLGNCYSNDTINGYLPITKFHRLLLTKIGGGKLLCWQQFNFW